MKKFGDTLKRASVICLVVALMATTAILTFALTYAQFGVGGSLSDGGAKVRELENILDQYYIGDYDKTDFSDLAVAGALMATGDPWSYYIPADQYEMFSEDRENAYGGIGVTVFFLEEEGALEINVVTPDGPADLAGLQVGDWITAVDGDLVSDLGYDETVSRVRGEVGTETTLTVVRLEETLEIPVTRDTVEEIVVEYAMMEGQIAHIKIYNFTGHSAEKTLEAIEQAVAEDAKAIVFDVRDNGGGYADEMVKILDRLLPEGELFRTVDYAGNETVDTSDEAFLDLPMAVLINANSYSAAEFFAGALQEYEAATIIGQKTTGKGRFQYTLPMTDGSAVNLSVGEYFTPSGKSLAETGVTPDVEIPLEDSQNSRDSDLELETALGLLEK